MPFTICRRQARRNQISDGGLRMADVREQTADVQPVVPSWDRRGGCASREYRRRHPLKAQTGWSVQNDHSSRAFLTFDGAATPPILGGEYAVRFRIVLLVFVVLLSACRQKMADQPRYDPY